MPGAMRRPAQTAYAKGERERDPHYKAAPSGILGATHRPAAGCQQREDDAIVVPRGRGLNALAIETGVLLVQQRVVHALALLPNADAPRSCAHLMHDLCVGCADKLVSHPK